jgi:hypothetical protein
MDLEIDSIKCSIKCSLQVCLLGSQSVRESIRGGMGPSATEGVCVEAPPSAGCQLNFIQYMSFRMFAYSSKIFKTNFERLDSMIACGILKNSKI